MRVPLFKSRCGCSTGSAEVAFVRGGGGREEGGEVLVQVNEHWPPSVAVAKTSGNALHSNPATRWRPLKSRGTRIGAHLYSMF